MRNKAVGKFREDDHQELVARWLKQRQVKFFNPPNGGVRSIREASRFKRMGVQSCIPDLIIVTPPPHKPKSVGVALELKRDHSSKLRPSQKEWLETLTAYGWTTEVGYGFEDAINKLQKLGY